MGVSGITEGANASRAGAFLVWSNANVGSSESNKTATLLTVVLVADVAAVMGATVESVASLLVPCEDKPDSLALEQAATSTNTDTHASH